MHYSARIHVEDWEDGVDLEIEISGEDFVDAAEKAIAKADDLEGHVVALEKLPF